MSHSKNNNTILTLYNKEIYTSSPSLPVSHPLMTFGFSIYDTIFIKNYIPIFYKEHLKRNYDAICFLGFKNPKKVIQNLHYDLKKIINYAKQKLFPTELFRLRISIFPEEFSFPKIHFQNINYTIVLTPISKISAIPTKYQLYISSHKKPVYSGYPPYLKFCANSIHIMATKEVQDKVDNKSLHTDALLMDQDGNLCESSFGNIFIKKDNYFYTPSLKHNLLDGITRNILLKILEHHKISISETTLKFHDLISSQECYITSSVRGIQPIESIIYELPTLNNDKNILLFTKKQKEKRHIISYSNLSTKTIQEYYTQKIQTDLKKNKNFSDQEVPNIFF